MVASKCNRAPINTQLSSGLTPGLPQATAFERTCAAASPSGPACAATLCGSMAAAFCGGKAVGGAAQGACESWVDPLQAQLRTGGGNSNAIHIMRLSVNSNRVFAGVQRNANL